MANGEQRRVRMETRAGGFVEESAGFGRVVRTKGDLSHFPPPTAPRSLPPSVPASAPLRSALRRSLSHALFLHVCFQMAVIIQDMKSHFSSAWLLQSS